MTELEKIGAPADVVAALRRLEADLARAAGASFAGLVLYGGLARGRYRPGRSDVNVVLLLRDAGAATLAAVAPALRAAWRALRVEALVLTPAEVRRAAVAFPTKLLDIQRHHVVLAGADPFTGLDVPRERVRLRAEQELRNLGLRLRRRFVTVSDDPAALVAALGRIAVPLSVELAAALGLAEKAPEDDAPAAVFEAAAAAFDLDRPTLAALAALRAGGPAPDDPVALYDRTLALVARAADVLAAMEAAP